MRRALGALGLLVALGGLAGCDAKKDAAPASGKKGGRQALVFAADVMPVEARPVEYEVTAPGTIDAFERVQVTSRVAGVVDRVAFTEGQTVKKGDALVVIDSERFRLSVNSSQAALDKVQAAQKDVEAMVARREGASDSHPGLIPGEELETYRTRALTAKADTQVAVEALKTAQLNLRDSSVRAPMEGIIQTRTVETGQYVQPGYVMATLLRKDPMLLRFQVEPSEAPRIKPGMTAKFTMRETQREFAARVTLVAAAADLVTHMVPVTAELTESDHKYWLRPGAFCDVAVPIGSGERKAPVIPRLATRATDHGYVAYVVEGDVARERVLILGMNTRDGWVEVREGLAAGDRLVVRGAEALVDGAKVKANPVGPESFLPGADAGALASGPSGDGPREGRGRRDAGAP